MLIVDGTREQADGAVGARPPAQEEGSGQGEELAPRREGRATPQALHL
jgi:hypothetical protein